MPHLKACRMLGQNKYRKEILKHIAKLEHHMKGLRRPGKWKWYSRFYSVGIMQYQNIFEYMNHARQACQAQTFVGKLGHKQNCPSPACMQQPKPGGPKALGNMEICVQ